MTERDEFLRQPVNDPFGAAVQFGRNCFRQRSYLGNPHEPSPRAGPRSEHAFRTTLLRPAKFHGNSWPPCRVGEVPDLALRAGSLSAWPICAATRTIRFDFLPIT